MNKIKTRRITAREKKNLAIRWTLYAFIILFCYITATSGSFRKPLLLIPVSLCIASYAREHTAVITGIVCGLLLDNVCGKLLGFNALILCFMCIGISMLYKHFLMHRILNFTVLAAAGIFIQGVLDYFFFYAIWDHENVSFIYTHHILPCCIYTLISALPVYAVIHNINRMLRPNTVRTIEEAVISEEDQ
ncbi:MAG: rod shape-determining protein MreD [Oscillospiraceae bacterium]|nr:rod shape-determining protein MreD [Oscillospiraceae bacterium]